MEEVLDEDIRMTTTTPGGSGLIGVGTWGERDVSGPVNINAAAAFNEKYSQETKLPSLATTSTNGYRANGAAAEKVDDKKEEDKNEEHSDDYEEDFQLINFLREGHLGSRDENGYSTKRLGVVFEHLNVQGVVQSATFVKTIPFIVMDAMGPSLFRFFGIFLPFLRFGPEPQLRTLIHDFSGVVKDGEMMLVLGRPGSGCTTFLKTVANIRKPYAAVNGAVTYGGITAEEQAKHYRGEVAYNEEDDVHFASLNVWQTLRFALTHKMPKRDKHKLPIVVNALLRMFGISHTAYTLVGDAYLRGISGGERKRVSISESLAGNATVLCWDNSTRGLDASTALDYAKSLRVMTDVSNRTTLVTLYQAGEDIYNLMDKVMVLHEARMIYQGPANEAKQYFIDLGFRCPERQTTADFLTAVTNPIEQKFQPGMEARAPKSAEELEAAFRNSKAYRKVLEDIEDYKTYLQKTKLADAEKFKLSVQQAKSKTVSKGSSYTVSFLRNLRACVQREFWLLWGDKPALYTKFFILISCALIVSSIFTGQALDTVGAFSRGGTLLFSVVFLAWMQLAELGKAVSGRTVISRHKDYAFYRPAVVSLARVIMDIPFTFIQVTIFSIIVYFLGDLDREVSKFFIYFLFVYTTTICITAMYRMFASLSASMDDALRFSGTLLNLLIIFTGYAIPKPQLLNRSPWVGWIYWINPLSYAFEAVLSSEFSNRNLTCAEAQVAPRDIPGLDVRNQGCGFAGAQPFSNSNPNPLSITGEHYLQVQYTYSKDHIWRNFGVLLAFTVFFIVVSAVASEYIDFSAGSGGGALMFKRRWGKSKKVLKGNILMDEETGGVVPSSGPSQTSLGEAEQISQSSQNEFTWRDVEYTVPLQGGGERKLLNSISGYAKPGVMVALMGASGAGKTTLLNTLAQRQRVGVVGGEMLVNGHKLGVEFQRGTGFCEQMDQHDGTQTIREALEFSAILRQEYSVPRNEKLAYVDKVINLLELNELQDAIVSSLGVEQRKRLTIGVELVAKPNLLLFLDEPTSGLDSQSAYSIVRFLKKLAQGGQAIVCTLHQPSSQLIKEFDVVLALNPGGNTFYFGPFGRNGSEVVKYFGDRGFHCPPSKNVAEFILETAAKGGRRPDGRQINWDEEWHNSPERQSVLHEIDRICSKRDKIEAPNSHLQREFASPVWLQTLELTRRMFTQYWRDPAYLYSKFFTTVVISFFMGFTYWDLTNSILDMQNRMFVSFLELISIPPTVIGGVLARFFVNRLLWEGREYPSRIYGWFAFCTANIVVEMPWAIVCSVLSWPLWYYPVDLPRDSSTSGYVFLMTLLFFLFIASWGQWICSFAPSFTVIANTLPFFLILFTIVNGVIRPFSSLPDFWRDWIYYVNPSTYWIGGVVSATQSRIRVDCSPSELAIFTPPFSNQTCEDFAGAWAATTPGYLTNPSALQNCGYCAFRSGVEYLDTLNISADEKWRDFGIFLAFCVSNVCLVYFFTYTVRVKGWTFGVGRTFAGVSNAKAWVMRMLGGGKKS